MKQTFDQLMTRLHLKSQGVSMLILVLVMSLLYCSMYSIILALSYSITQPILYYLVQYILYLGLSVLNYLLFTQFIRNRQNRTQKPAWKDFLFPLVKLETIFFVILEGLGYLYFASGFSTSGLMYLITVLLILMLIVYFPLKFYGYHQIEKGVKNPFLMLKDGCKCMIRHYQSLFYSTAAIAVLYFLQYFICTFFDYFMPFHLGLLSNQILFEVHPFMLFYNGIVGAIPGSIGMLIWSLLSGIVIAMGMMLYYAFLINVFDEEVSF